MSKEEKKEDIEKKDDSPKKDFATSAKPLIFISHDSKDAELAIAFGELVKKSSAGVISYFCSSDKTGKSGIDYGMEWYKSIKEKIESASDVVCLLTERSIGRPWLLYEAGMARGRNESTVLGLVLSMNMEVVTKGPFAQFQNCSDDEDDLIKLVKQLVARIPNADPDTEVIRTLVKSFLEKEKAFIKKISSSKEKKPLEKDVSSNTSAPTKIFEEVKYMFNELMRVQQNSSFNVSRKSDIAYRIYRNIPFIFEDLPPNIAIRFGLSLYKEYAPWVFEEGNHLLNRLLLKNYDSPSEIMRAFEILFGSSRRIFMEISEGNGLELERISHRILEYVDRLLHENEMMIHEKEIRSSKIPLRRGKSVTI